jgi:hypothetical protein
LWYRHGFFSQVDREGFVLILVAPLHACVAARPFAFLAPLVLLLGLLGLAALHGRVVHALAILVVKDGPHRLLIESEAGGNVEQLVGVDRRTPLELMYEVTAGRALKEGMHDLGLSHARELSAALREASYEVPERFAGLLGARPQVPGVPRAHVRVLEVPHERADQVIPVIVKPQIFIENPNPCTIAIVPGSVAIAYRTSHK